MTSGWLLTTSQRELAGWPGDAQARVWVAPPLFVDVLSFWPHPMGQAYLAPRLRCAGVGCDKTCPSKEMMFGIPPPSQGWWRWTSARHNTAKEQQECRDGGTLPGPAPRCSPHLQSSAGPRYSASRKQPTGGRDADWVPRTRDIECANSRSFRQRVREPTGRARESRDETGEMSTTSQGMRTRRFEVRLGGRRMVRIWR
jgi:hypothetical protein